MRYLIIILLVLPMASCTVKTTATLPDGKVCEFKSRKNAILTVKTPEGFEFTADLTGGPTVLEQTAALVGGSVIGTTAKIREIP